MRRKSEVLSEVREHIVVSGTRSKIYVGWVLCRLACGHGVVRAPSEAKEQYRVGKRASCGICSEEAEFVRASKSSPTPSRDKKEKKSKPVDETGNLLAARELVLAEELVKTMRTISDRLSRLEEQQHKQDRATAWLRKGGVGERLPLITPPPAPAKPQES